MSEDDDNESAILGDDEYEGEDSEVKLPEFEDKFLKEPLPRSLTREEAGECLCLLGKTICGLEYAYLMMKANNKGLTEIKVIPSFTNVLFVDVCGNYLREKDLDILAYMDFLLMIKADDNLLSSARITPMQYLQVLTMNRNAIKSTEGIYHPLLECLELNYNHIPEVIGLDPGILHRLKVLELRGNVLSSIQGITCPTLERLYLAENQIDNLMGIDQLESLQLLHIRDNPLTSFNGVSEKLSSLTYLNVRNCKIEDVSEVKKLAPLCKLETLILLENPFTEAEEESYRIEILIYVPTLKRIDKAIVQEDEIEEADQAREERKAEEEGGEEEEEDDED